MQQQLLADAALLSAQAHGYFKEQGLNVQLQVINNGTTAIPLLASGQLDFAVGAPGTALFNAIARGSDVRMVADKGAQSPDGKNGFTLSLIHI